MKELRSLLSFYGKTVEDVKAIPIGEFARFEKTSGHELDDLHIAIIEKIDADHISIQEGWSEFLNSEPEWYTKKVFKI